jgi:hypothetical protein
LPWSTFRRISSPTTHWSIPDPVTVGDTEPASYRAFERTAADIDTRIRYLLPALPHVENESNCSNPADRSKPRHFGPAHKREVSP